MQMITDINNKKATLNFDIRKVINILKCKLVYHSTANHLYCHSSSKPQSGWLDSKLTKVIKLICLLVSLFMHCFFGSKCMTFGTKTRQLIQLTWARMDSIGIFQLKLNLFYIILGISPRPPGGDHSLSYTDFHTIVGREEGGPHNCNSTKVDVCHWEVFQMDFPPAYAQLNTFLEHK